MKHQKEERERKGAEIKCQIEEESSVMQLNLCAFMQYKMGLMQQRDNNVNYDHITATYPKGKAYSD